jgi:hypothetical protein
MPLQTPASRCSRPYLPLCARMRACVKGLYCGKTDAAVAAKNFMPLWPRQQLTHRMVQRPCSNRAQLCIALHCKLLLGCCCAHAGDMVLRLVVIMLLPLLLQFLCPSTFFQRTETMPAVVTKQQQQHDHLGQQSHQICCSLPGAVQPAVPGQCRTAVPHYQHRVHCTKRTRFEKT